MITEHDLSAAANTIGQMSHTELQRKFREMKDARNARTREEALRQQSELDSLELEQAAFELALQAEAKGDLDGAARWFRAAAINDFADANLRLAKVLDRQAELSMIESGSLPSRSHEGELYAEACRWYGDAYAAGLLEAAELLDKMIERHATRRIPSRPTLVVAESNAAPDLGSCRLGGLQNVMGRAVSEGADHVASCSRCQHEMAQPGALAVYCSHATEVRGPDSSPPDRGPSLNPEPSSRR